MSLTTSSPGHLYGTIVTGPAEFVVTGTQSDSSATVFGQSLGALTHTNEFQGMAGVVTLGAPTQQFNMVEASNVNRGMVVLGTIALGLFGPGEPGAIIVGNAMPAPNPTSGLMRTRALEIAPLRGNRLELEILLANKDQDWITPTRYSYNRALAILESVVDLPVTFMTTDPEGGIRMAWRQGRSQVRANFAARPELRSYIYYESPIVHDVEDLDALNLLKRLSWLTGR